MLSHWIGSLQPVLRYLDRIHFRDAVARTYRHLRRQGRGRGVGVCVIEINMVGLQLAQTFINPIFDLFCQLLPLVVAIKACFRCQNHSVTAFAAGEVFTQQCFTFVTGTRQWA